MSFFDRYYALLELDASASHADVKRAYRRLAKLYHPDRSGDPATRSKFIEVNEAYETILQKDKLLAAALIRYTEKRNGQHVSRAKDNIRQNSVSYADMRFSKFEKTPIYQAAKAVNKISTLIFFIAGSAMIVAPFVGYYLQIYHPEVPGKEPVFEFLPIFIGLAFVYGLWYFTIKNADS